MVCAFLLTAASFEHVIICSHCTNLPPVGATQLFAQRSLLHSLTSHGHQVLSLLTPVLLFYSLLVRWSSTAFNMGWKERNILVKKQTKAFKDQQKLDLKAVKAQRAQSASALNTSSAPGGAAFSISVKYSDSQPADPFLPPDEAYIAIQHALGRKRSFMDHPMIGLQ